MSRCRTAAGTSLIEILVVIVVLLVGILAVVQVFPGGLRLLLQSRNQAIAQQMDSALLTNVVGRPDGLPEQILPVKYTLVAGKMVIDPDPARRTDDLSPLGDSLDSVGVLSSGGNPVGYWPYVSGPNVMRRIVGENHRVPGPRAVGQEYGCLTTLSFGPVLTSTPHPTTITYQPAFEVYGSDLIENQGAPTGGVVPTYEFFLDHANQVDGTKATLYLPRLTTSTPDGPGSGPGPNYPPGPDDIIYRVSMTVWIADASANVTRRDIVTNVVAYGDPAGGFETIDMSARGNVYDSTGTPIANGISNLAATETLDSVEPESVRVAREFVQVKPVSAGGPGFTLDPSTSKPNRPYEYEVLSWELGQLLFSPAGYNYYESRPEGRIPLTARVTYDVFDWRIIRDDFRIPDKAPLQYKLTLSSLRVKGGSMPDGTTFSGLNLDLYTSPNGSTVLVENRDFALIDMETGGVYLPFSYSVDKSAGLITFNSSQMKLVYPDGTNTISTINAAGRSVRALYMGNSDWSVQLMKAPAQYLQTYVQPTVGQYYVGGSGAIGGSTTRIYFPGSDVNQKVRIAEIIYQSSIATAPISVKDQDYIIRDTPADALGPYIDIKTQIDQNATAFDIATYGYSVKGVKGLTLTARSLWNSDGFTLGTDTAANLNALRRFQTGYHRSVLDTVVQRGDNL